MGVGGGRRRSRVFPRRNSEGRKREGGRNAWQVKKGRELDGGEGRRVQARARNGQTKKEWRRKGRKRVVEEKRESFVNKHRPRRGEKSKEGQASVSADWRGEAR